jgi:outer membrane protein TolC
MNNRLIMINLIWITIFWNSINLLVAQNTFQIKVDSLPTLKFFLDSGITHSPAVKMYQTSVDQNKEEYKLQKYNWLKEIYISADSKYGRYGNAQPADQLALGYGTGAVIKLPLTTIFGNKEKKNIAKLKIEESNFQKEVIIEELTKSIIKQYNETLYRKELLKLRSESLEFAYVNNRLAEKEFKGGTITIDQYARVSEVYFTQLQLMEEAKMQLTTTFTVLLEMTGFN